MLDLSLKTSVMLSLWMFHDSGYDTRDDRIRWVSIAGGAWTDVARRSHVTMDSGVGTSTTWTSPA